ncbi:MAG: YdiU family protein [Pseudomonadales bacterium]
MHHFRNSFAGLPDVFYSRVQTSALKHPHWVVQNHELARQLGIAWQPDAGQKLLCACSGGEPLAGSEPLAMVYAGHQFGQYVPQLGDGRGVLLGELPTACGNLELHLKGAGQTPYSRFGDGRAVLRSCIREYIGSEALHALGVPTTRALCITSGSDTVWRETLEPVAMMCRVAQSHVRFGSFEFFHYTRQPERVQQLADFCIQHYYTQLAELPAPARYAAFLQAVVGRTAALIASWQAIGFAHGVLNTDNMSIVGDTFDFGPFGFLDRYEPGYICNHSDHHGRYAFNAQPHIGLWNLSALAEALASLVEKDQRDAALAQYEPALIEQFESRMRAKLGFAEQMPEDSAMIFSWLELMQRNGADYSLGFRYLADLQSSGDESRLRSQFTVANQDLEDWLQRYRKRLQAGALTREESAGLMQQNNPLYIPRNYLAQEAIEQADNGNYAALQKLLEVLSNPYREQAGCEHYAEPAPAWSEQLEISCSS